MNTFTIKLFAILFMVIDHIGLFFFPQHLEFRIIGRLAFPLFAWLIANGARHTHNIRLYLIRIFFFAAISQIPYILANKSVDPYYTGLNVLFTLGFGLLAIIFIQRTENKALWFLISAVCAGAAHVLNADYGMFGVFVTICFYLFFNKTKLLVLSQLVLFLFPYIFLLGYRQGSIEPFGLLALLFIMFYNKKEGIKSKYLFYIFYPLHYLIIYLLRIWGNY